MDSTGSGTDWHRYDHASHFLARESSRYLESRIFCCCGGRGVLDCICYEHGLSKINVAFLSVEWLSDETLFRLGLVSRKMTAREKGGDVVAVCLSVTSE